MSPPLSTNDHCTISAVLDLKIKAEPSYEWLVWHCKKANFDNFITELANHDFSSCFDTDDIDDIVTKWTESFLNAARNTVPNRKVNVRPKDYPWYTNKMRKLKHSVIRQYKKNANRMVHQ